MRSKNSPLYLFWTSICEVSSLFPFCWEETQILSSPSICDSFVFLFSELLDSVNVCVGRVCPIGDGGLFARREARVDVSDHVPRDGSVGADREAPKLTRQRACVLCVKRALQKRAREKCPGLVFGEAGCSRPTRSARRRPAPRPKRATSPARATAPYFCALCSLNKGFILRRLALRCSQRDGTSVELLGTSFFLKVEPLEKSGGIKKWTLFG